MSLNERSLSILKRLLRYGLYTAGAVFITILILSFTTLPYWMYHDLGTYGEESIVEPEYIVLLGADGMPSETNLMRCDRAASLAGLFPSSILIIALPVDSGSDFFSSSHYKMQQELQLKGVDSVRIRHESSGRNTRDQAIRISGKMIPENAPTVIVTSPEHMYRSIRTFRKAGLREVGGRSAFGNPLESELDLTAAELGGREMPGTGTAKQTQLRYQFWNHLRYQVICYREYVAIAYYKLKHWI
ncbi:MAG: YdcF family protein [Bacteroidota bacterium]